MRIAIGSDERTSLTDHVVAHLEGHGHSVELVGALSPGDERLWPRVGAEVAQRVVSGACDTGIAFCWTGTGVSIAANKVAGARAALCWDAATARGARLWNDANVLALSLRSISNVVAEEIVEAWLAPLQGKRDAEDRRALEMLTEIDAGDRRPQRLGQY